MPNLEELFGKPDAGKKLTALFGQPDAKSPDVKAAVAAEPDIKIKGQVTGAPEGLRFPTDLSKEEAQTLTPYLKAFDETPPGHPARLRILNELKRLNAVFAERRKDEALLEKVRTPGAGEKIAAGVTGGFMSGVSAGHASIFQDYQKNLERMVRDPFIPKDIRKSTETMAKISNKQLEKLQDNAIYKWSNLAGEIGGMAVPFGVLNKATAFIKLGKMVPNLSKTGQAFLKVAENMTREAAIGGMYGAVEKLEEGEGRLQNILEDAALFSLFSGALSGVGTIFKKGEVTKILSGSKTIDDFYKKVTKKVAEHPVGRQSATMKNAPDELIYLREHYGTRDNPILMDGKRFELGNEFWYGEAAKKKFDKMFEEHGKLFTSKEGGKREFPGLEKLMKQELDAIDLTRGKQPLTSTLTLGKSRRPAQEIADKLGVARSQPRRLTAKERLIEQQRVAKKTQPKPEIKGPREKEVKFPARGRQEFKKAWEESGMKKGDVDENMRIIQKAIEKNPKATPQVYVKAETGEIVTQQAFNHSDLIIKSGMKHSDVIDSGWKVGDDFYSYFYGKLPKQKPKDIKLPKEFGKVEKEVPVFTPKTNTPQATLVGKQFKNNSAGIEVLERRMIQSRNRAEQFKAEYEKTKNLDLLSRAQQPLKTAAMYREAWEVATGRMPELLDDIKPFFEKRRSFLNSLDEITARAEKRLKIRWDKNAMKFYGGLPIDPIRTASDLADLSIIGAQRIIRGANTSAKFANEMIKTYGDRIKPHIDALYKKSLGHVKRFLKAVEDKAHSMPSLKQALTHFKKGEYAAGWYNKTGEEIRKMFGDKDGDMFLDFVAITSPQTTPKANVTKALELFKRWKLGQTGDEFKYGTGEQWDFFKKAIKGEEFGGRKIQNFRKNLKGDLDPVTVDMWMFEIYFGKTNGTPIQFKFIEEDIKRLAKELNRKPAEVQAAMWVGYKELPQNVKRGGEGSYDAIEHYVKQQFAASKHKAPDAWLLDGIADRMVKTGVKEAKVELGGKKFAIDLMKAAGKDIRNTELGITTNPYKNIEEFLGKHKLVLTDQEKQKIKAFMQSLAQRKLLSTSEAEKEINRFIETQFGERFKVVSDVRKATAKSLAPLPPDTRKWYTRWMDGELLGDINVKSTIRKAIGRRKRSVVNAEEASKDRVEWFDKQADDFNVQFMSQIERGIDKIKDPRLREIAKDYRKRLDRAWADSFVESNGRQAYIEDYFPHLWEDPGKAKKFFTSEYSGFYKNPGFLKKRYYDFIEDGMNAGLKLKTTNPELLVLERELSGFRFRETKNILDELKGSGYLKFIKSSERPPAGWSKLTKSRSLEVIIPGAGKIGDLYVPEQARKVIDNYLSKGFWSIGETPFKQKLNKSLRGISMIKNVMLAYKLGLSGFHFIETTTSAHTMQFKSALHSLARGDFRQAISKFGNWLPFVGETHFVRKGGDIYRAWKTGKFKNDYEKWAVEQIETAGGALSMPEQWHRGVQGQWRKAKQLYRKGKVFRATARLPIALMEQAMKPLMEQYIPRLKAYSYIESVKDFARRHPEIKMHSKEWEKNIGKLWDNVDNRFGQLQYDNLFFNRMARDIGVMSQISMGWNIGTWREFGGAANDILKFTAGKALKQKPDVLIDKALYSSLYIAHFGSIGGLTTYLLTGEYPKQFLDFFYPRTGNINQDGTAERLQMPTMLKEAAASTEAVRKDGILLAPLTYGRHKIAPIFSMTADLLLNEDFYGVEITDKNAPIYEQMENYASFILEQGFMPISISSYNRHIKRTAGKSVKGRKVPDEALNYAAPFIGFSIAPGYVVKTAIQKEIFDMFSKRIGGGKKTKEQWEKYKKKSEVKMLAITDPKKGLKEFLALQSEGVIPKNTKWSTFKRSAMTPADIRAFGRLPKGDQDYLWSKMSKEERMKYKKSYHKFKSVPRYIPN